MWTVIFIEVDRFKNIQFVKEYNASTAPYSENDAVRLCNMLQEKNKIPNRTYYAVEL